MTAGTRRRRRPDQGATAARRAGNPGPVIVTRHQLAALLGVHPDRVSEYTHAGLPVLHRGGAGGDKTSRQSRYDAIACAQWVRRHRPGAFDAQAERAALDRKRGAEIDFRMQVKRGEYLPARTAEAAWSGHVVTARNQLLGIPSRLKTRRPELAREDLQAIDALIREALEELADGADTSTDPKGDRQ